ncbi:GT-D fold domain-containing glycosyltransferase [Anaerovibrio lipolyticus]|uniref:GT-D fold domain-containing glycosyltransferase n=1 Tax=Anaerovibrio lipolyticus TaxID=82374 RepID=UPI000489CDC2|nr:GT-D fold domain-containing glycosyltransferase [Anaerovibrio lipolyticus]
MIKVYIWGVGAARIMIREALNTDKCELKGYIDNNPDKIGQTVDNLPIFSLGMVLEYDYIIASIREYYAVIHQYRESGKVPDKLICFFDSESFAQYADIGILDRYTWENVLLKEENKKIKLRLRNNKYEVLDAYRGYSVTFPKLGDTSEAINKMADGGCSFIRFGDGEFEIMAGKNRAPFQRCSDELGLRLREIVQVNEKNLLLGIADNYGELDKYTEDIADGIREYMTEDVRRFHLSVLNMSMTYYDAYMFKPYMPYKDKENTPRRIANIKRIWDNKNIVIIEGDKTRTGAGNDLLDNAATIERVLAPTKNAFDRYNEIKNKAMNLPKDKLILMVLGPAGKVLAYDLFKAGYQVVDIGQIDMDYDWYKAGLGYKVSNKYKYVSQIADQEILDIDDPKYYGQIIAKIL